MTRRWSALAALAFLLAGGCGSGTVTPRTLPPAASPPSPLSLDHDCVAAASGYTIRYPASWFTTVAPGGSPCRFFHPEPFELPPGSEATGIAVMVQLVDLPMAGLVPGREGTIVEAVIERRATSVEGRTAMRLVTRASGRGLLAGGTRATTWYVEFPHGTLVATTNEAAVAGTWAANVAVLDAMVASATPVDRPACSAAALALPELSQELPDPVARTRSAIVTLAVACDYAGLSRLALAGGSFRHSFGDGGDPGAYWRARERAGDPVLGDLVKLLAMPRGLRQLDDSSLYVWPSAYAHERWEDVPEEDRDALRTVYSDGELTRFAEVGAYLGRRAGITGGGTWIFFLGGD